MKRNRIGILYTAIVLALTNILSGCNLFSSNPPDADATQTALSAAGAQLFFDPAILNTPTFENTSTPTLTPDPILFTATPTATPSATPTANPKPTTYTLQVGEFPYCIARRFNVDPRELLTSNNLGSGLLVIYSPGLILSIPQTGKPFPATRALRPHPASYTVPAPMTVHQVACYYGDVEPALIMQNNGLTSPVLTVGQILQIP